MAPTMDASISPSRSKTAHGFTLIELLTTIAIAAILLGIAAPSFVTIRRNSQLTATANSFMAALSSARSEALKRQLNVFVKPGDGNQADWALGWTVFVDGNWDNAIGDASDVTIATQSAIPAGVTALDGTSGYVKFTGAGFVQTTSNAPPTGTLYVRFSNATEQRYVLISPAGRMRVCKPNTTTCNTTDTF